MISAVICGHVGQDAQLRDVKDSKVLNFTMASRRFEGGEEHTDWINVAFWGGKRAESIEEYVTKGARVTVRGGLHVREYTDKEKNKRFSLELRADEVELFGGGKKDEDEAEEKSSSKSNGKDRDKSRSQSAR